MILYALSFIILILNSSHYINVSAVAGIQEPGKDHGMLLIPGGEFRMGTMPNPYAAYVDDPLHTVRIDAFYIEKYEVTNAEYLEFCEATQHHLPEFWGMDKFCSGPEFPDHPVTGVTWNDAMAYASWKGLRLPTEAEWEFAARGGLVDKMYPNGDQMDPSLANYNGTQGKALPVGSYPANGFGLCDMAGNVTEWVLDYYDKDYYLEGSGKNPQGPEAGKRRVIRGGGWRSGSMCCTVYFRQSLRPNWVDFNVGFRCARSMNE
jgi:formylglycine-generating enzyme required for sulfatase activity